MKTVYPDENNVVLNEKIDERKLCINRESKSDEITIELYSCHDNKMKFLVFVPPLSIYHQSSLYENPLQLLPKYLTKHNCGQPFRSLIFLTTPFNCTKFILVWYPAWRLLT